MLFASSELAAIHFLPTYFIRLLACLTACLPARTTVPLVYTRVVCMNRSRVKLSRTESTYSRVDVHSTTTSGFAAAAKGIQRGTVSSSSWCVSICAVVTNNKNRNLVVVCSVENPERSQTREMFECLKQQGRRAVRLAVRSSSKEDQDRDVAGLTCALTRTRCCLFRYSSDHKWPVCV